MRLLVHIGGLNLERFLRAASAGGLMLGGVRRVDERTVCALVWFWQLGALRRLCARCGWELREARAGALIRAARMLAARRMLAAGIFAGVALVYLLSQTVLAVRIVGAGESVAEARRLLAQEGVAPGRLKAGISVSRLQEALALGLPGLSFAGVRFAGSTLVVECQPARAGETLDIAGDSPDLVAAQDGIVTRIWASSGTPLVKPGQAVRRGQTLVRGEERAGGGGTAGTRAQGQVLARVWARGDARVSLWREHTVETGAVRTRVTLHTPWYERVVADAQPFASQDASMRTEPLVGLYLPVCRRIETFAQTVVTRTRRAEADAKEDARGAAEALAKNKCPAGAEILDKWTEYSKINDEYVCATVILEYERDIAARPGG